MSHLKATPEFARLCQGFHQDCLYAASNQQELIENLLGFVSPAEHQALKQFLGHILDGRYTQSELRGLMNRSAPELRWSSKGAASVLTAIHERLSKAD